MPRERTKRMRNRVNPYKVHNNPSLTHREAIPFDENLSKSFEEEVLAEVVGLDCNEDLHNLFTLAIVANPGPPDFPKAGLKRPRSRLNYVSRFAVDPLLGAGKNNSIKIKWLFSNANNSFYKENTKPSTEANKKAEVKFKFQAYDKLLANNKFGAWGLAPIHVEVVQKKDEATYSCPPKCSINLHKFSIEDVANWWQGTRFPYGHTTKRKVRDLILSNLPIAKLFAVGWPPKCFRERLLVAYKNPRVKHSLQHNKEYCPTAFTVEPGGHNSFYAFHQERTKWIRFPDLCYLPIDIVGMLGGEGGLLLLYGNAKPVPQHNRESHTPPWNHPQLSHANPPQHILVVCNPITRQHVFIPPLTVSLRFMSARMSVSKCSSNYTIHLTGWCRRTDVPRNRLELRLACYASREKSWFEHHEPCRLVRPIGQPPFKQNYDNMLPLVKDKAHNNGATLYTVGEHAPDPKKPFEFKHAVVSCNLHTLQWVLHPWILEQPLPPHVPSDPPLMRSDPPTVVECNDDLFGVARCFEGTRAFVQVHKLVGLHRGDDGIQTQEFVKHGTPMPDHYFHMNYPRNLYPYESPLHLNCVSGAGNLWIASPNQCMVMFFNVKLGRWSNIASMKLDNGKSKTHHLGNWAFEPAIHARVEG